MREKIIEYLLANSPFNYSECEGIADEIEGISNAGYIREVIMSYIGGEDDYAYETAYELAEGILKL